MSALHQSSTVLTDGQSDRMHIFDVLLGLNNAVAVDR